MRKLLCFIFLFFCVSNLSYSNLVDSVMARKVALSLYAQISTKQVLSLNTSLVERSQDGTPVFYVFNINDSDGFVLVSGDDGAFPVLGYSDKGHWNANNISPELNYWVSGYKKQINYIKDNKIQPTIEIISQWHKYLNKDTLKLTTTGLITNGGTAVVLPLLKDIKWGQSQYYNDKCPNNIFFQKRTLTGCVATTMAQIMKYWNYPQQGIGSHTYIAGFYGLQTANFSNTKYNWANMPNSINSPNDDISTLMFHCGVSVDMDYGVEESDAYVIEAQQPVCAESAYKKYFGFNSNTIKGLIRSNNESNWINILKDELNNKRPIQYAGFGTGGHTWVCDGYDINSFFHMNWGWNPINSEDGYYNLNSLNNKILNFDFTNGQIALIGIQPPCLVPDLTIVGPTLNKASASPGDQIIASCIEKNNGQTKALNNIIKIYLSKNTDVTNAVLLGQISVSNVSQLNQTSLLNTNITIPSNTTSGLYYIVFWGDANQTIVECFEDNNFVSIPINIIQPTCPKPQNDECSGSFSATFLNFSTTGNCTNSISATSCGAVSSGFPACGNTLADDDVFFQFVPTVSNATISVSPSSGYDAVFQLLAGPCGVNMQSISQGCINNNGLGVEETQTFNGLIPGNTYYIRVWHAGSGSGSGNFNICVYGNNCNTPGTPNLISPGTSTFTGQILNITTPTFNSSTVSGASAYIIHISREPYGLNNLVYTSSCIIPPFTIPAGILQNGINYRWDIQALQNCNSSCSSLSNNFYFTINSESCAKPSNQANNISFTGVSTNQMIVSCNVGNGIRRIIKINTTNSFSDLVDKNALTANNTYSGSGEQIIYDGISTGSIVYGLTPGTSYYFKVYEANCSGNLSVYNNNNAINNPNNQSTLTLTCTSPTIQASNFTFNAISQNSIALSWSNGNGTQRFIKINTSNSFNIPTNGIEPINISSDYGGSGEQFVYGGTGNSITITGLSSNTLYYYRIFEANCSSNSIVYNTTSSIAQQSTTSGCTKPPIPKAETGDATCGVSYPVAFSIANSYNLNWSNATAGSGLFYDIEVREYPYNTNNVVYTQNCMVGYTASIQGSNVTPGKLYSWRVRATNDCSACFSDWSQPAYFSINPSISVDYGATTCDGSGLLVTTPIISVNPGINVNTLWFKCNGTIRPTTDTLINTGSSYLITKTGYYYIRETYSGSVNCPGNDSSSASIPVLITIGSTPAAPQLSSNSPVCEGNNLTMSANSSENNVTYYWSGPNGFSSSNNSVTFPMVSTSAFTSVAGVYSCYVMKNGCPSASNSITLVVNPAPAVTFSTGFFGNPLALTVNSNSQNVDTYLWDFGDGQTSSASTTTHTYTNPGNYLVCLTGTKSSCAASSYCSKVTAGTFSSTNKTQSTFTKLFKDTSRIHKFWNISDFVQSNVDSGYISVGWYQNTATSSNTIQYFKTDKNGNVIWVRQLPSIGDCYISQIIQSQSGYLLSFVYNGLSSAMEIDEQGNIIWSKNYNSQINRFTKVNSGEYVGVGRTDNGINIIKINSLGNFIWKSVQTYNLYQNTGVYINNIIQDANGNLYLYGYIWNNSASPISNSIDGILVKLDPNGNQIWSKYFATGTNIEDRITSLIIDNTGNLLFTAYSVPSGSSNTGIIGKINSAGDFIAAKKLTTNYTANVISNNSSGFDCLIFGSPNKTMNISSFNSTLDLVNQKEFVFKQVVSIKPSLDNKFVIAGGQYPLNTNTGEYRYNLFKVGYLDNSCIDTISSSFSLTASTFSLTTLSSNTLTSGISNSGLTVASSTTNLSDSSICNACNLSSIITASASTTICSGSSIQLSANSGMSSYLWSNGKTTQSITVTDSGSYTVKITDQSGCTSTSQPTIITVSPIPGTPSISNNRPLVFCSGDSTVLTSSSSLGNQWYLNGAQISGAKQSTLVVKASGVYTVQVTNNANCISLFSVKDTVTVNSLPAIPIINNNRPLVFCSGDSTILSSTGLSGVIQWYTNGVPISGATQSSYIAKNSGIYTLQITNAAGCSSTSLKDTVTANALPGVPIINNSRPLTFLAGDSTVLVSSASNGNQWFLNGTAISGATSSSLVVKTGGTYTVKVVNGSGCSSVSAGVVVTINSSSIPVISNNRPLTFCPGDSTVLSSSSTTGNQWYLNGAIMAGFTQQSITVRNTGSYTIAVTNGTSTLFSSVVTVTMLPMPAPALIIPPPPPQKSFCAGDSIILRTASVSENNQWFLNGTLINGANQAYYVAKVGGIYSVQATNTYGCSNMSPKDTVIVNPLPSTPIINNIRPLSFLVGDSTVLTSSASSGNQWLLNGVVISGATQSSLTVKSGGAYTVKVVNGSGCFALSLPIIVTVNSTSIPIISNSRPLTFCSGDSTVLTSSFATGNQWMLNGVNISGANQQSLTVKSSGSYSVSVNSGLLNSASVQIVVSILPPPTISSSKSVFCNGDSALIAITTPPFPNVTNQWFLNGNAITGANLITYNAKIAGIYYLKITDNVLGCSAISSNETITVNSLPATPIITNTRPLSFLSGDSTILVSSASGSNQWLLNGVAISGATQTTLVVKAGGTYSVKTVNGSGCSSVSLSTVVTVITGSIPVISNSRPLTFCSGDSTILTSSSATGNQWMLNGVNITGAVLQSLTVKSSGTYSVVVNPGSLTSNSVQVLVSTLPPPTISSNKSSICSGDSSLLSLNPPPLLNVTHQWFLNGIAISGANQISYSTKIAGVYYLKITDNTLGCSSVSLNETITVNSLPAIPVITNNRPLVFCVGDSTVLSSSTANASNQWLLNGSTISGATQTSLIVKTAGVYSVVLKNVAGCSSTSLNDTVKVNTLPTPPVISGGPTTFCSGSSVALNSSLSTGNQWYKDGVLISSATGTSYTASTSGSYTDSIVGANGCKAGSLPVTVVAIVVPTPTITQKSDTLISSAITGNQWYLNGTILSGATNQKYKVLNTGTYTVKVTDANGCVSGLSAGLAVVVTAINNTTLNSPDWKIYPNPVLKGIFTVSRTNGISSTGFVTAQITTLDGRLIEEKQISNNSQWNINKLANGIYYLRILDKKSTFIYQIIKQ